MAFNGPPPPLTLTKTNGYTLPNGMSSHNYARLKTDILHLFDNPNVTADEKQELLNLDQARDPAGIQALHNLVQVIKTRLGLQGGRRRRRRTRRTRRTRRNKRSTRRR